MRLVSIRDGVVLLELIGACGSCASSAMTMKMGLEKRLMERIPSIRQVVQSELEAPPIDTEEVEKVLDGVRPFLKVAGGSLELMSISEVGDINLKMSGLAATLQSVRTEIAQRIQRHFKRSVRVQWL